MRKIQTKDLPDDWFLTVVVALSKTPWSPVTFTDQWDLKGRTRWVNYWDIAALYYLPEKVVLAKARKLIRRGLLNGCYCGCRGDLELTEKGCDFLNGG